MSSGVFWDRIAIPSEAYAGSLWREAYKVNLWGEAYKERLQRTYGKLIGSLWGAYGGLWGAYGELLGNLWGAYRALIWRAVLELIWNLLKAFLPVLLSLWIFFFFDPQCKCPCFIGVVEEGLSEFSRRNLTEILITLFMKSIRQAGAGHARALCVEIHFTRTFQVDPKCNIFFQLINTRFWQF